MDRVAPTLPDGDDRLCFPPVPPPPSSGTEKKESGDHRHSRRCRPSGKPSLISSHAHHPADAPTAIKSSPRLVRKICQSSASSEWKKKIRRRSTGSACVRSIIVLRSATVPPCRAPRTKNRSPTSTRRSWRATSSRQSPARQAHYGSPIRKPRQRLLAIAPARS